MCTVLTSSTVLWEYCNSKHAFICSLGQGVQYVLHQYVFVSSKVNCFVIVLVPRI